MDRTNRSKPPSTNRSLAPDEKAEKSKNPISALAKNLAEKMNGSKNSAKDLKNQKIPTLQNKKSASAQIFDENPRTPRPLNGKNDPGYSISGSTTAGFDPDKNNFKKNEASYKAAKVDSTLASTTSSVDYSE